METMVMDYVKKIDNTIPDLTTEIAFDYCDRIHKELKNTVICACASLVCGTAAIRETAELTAIASKTIIKKTVIRAKNVYCERTAELVVRR